MDEADPIPLLLCGVPDAEPDELRSLFAIVQGRRPRPAAAEALVERGLAERRRLGVGDSIRLFEGREPLAIVGLSRVSPTWRAPTSTRPCPWCSASDSASSANFVPA